MIDAVARADVCTRTIARYLQMLKPMTPVDQPLWSALASTGDPRLVTHTIDVKPHARLMSVDRHVDHVSCKEVRHILCKAVARGIRSSVPLFDPEDTPENVFLRRAAPTKTATYRYPGPLRK